MGDQKVSLVLQMIQDMKGWLKKGHVRYGLLSMACPIITLGIVVIWQRIAHADFWNSVLANTEDDANRHAGALMAYTEVVTQILSTGVACFVGLSFALASIAKQKKLLGIGLLALLINGSPLVILLVLLSRAR